MCHALKTQTSESFQSCSLVAYYLPSVHHVSLSLSVSLARALPCSPFRWGTGLVSTSIATLCQVTSSHCHWLAAPRHCHTLLFDFYWVSVSYGWMPGPRLCLAAITSYSASYSVQRAVHVRSPGTTPSPCSPRLLQSTPCPRPGQDPAPGWLMVNAISITYTVLTFYAACRHFLLFDFHLRFKCIWKMAKNVPATMQTLSGPGWTLAKLVRIQATLTECIIFMWACVREERQRQRQRMRERMGVLLLNYFLFSALYMQGICHVPIILKNCVIENFACVCNRTVCM